MKRGRRLWGLLLAGVVLVSGALWARRQWDPNRFHALPLPQLERWVADHPDDGDALYELGRRYKSGGQITDARQTLERARRLEPGNARLLNDLGEICADQGDYLSAQALFEQALQINPDLPDPYRHLGDLAGIQRNYALAIQRYRQSLARRPNDVDALTSLGSACADAQNRGEAEAAFQKAVSLDPRSAAVYQRWGLALLKLRDFPGARDRLRQALARAPNDAYTHLFLGMALAQQLRTPVEAQQAMQELDRATALGYAGGEADYARGLVFLWQKQYPQAIAALEAAVQKDAGGEDARYRLARAYLAAGQTAKGNALLQQFQRFKQTDPEFRQLNYQIALRPDDLKLRRRLADLCVDTGRYREALQQYHILSDANAGDAALYQGMARAAAAVGDTPLAEQARANLQRLAATGHR